MKRSFSAQECQVLMGGDVLKGKDLTGKRFGKLTVLEPTDQRVRDAVVWRCRCECGNEMKNKSKANAS